MNFAKSFFASLLCENQAARTNAGADSARSTRFRLQRLVLCFSTTRVRLRGQVGLEPIEGDGASSRNFARLSQRNTLSELLTVCCSPVCWSAGGNAPLPPRTRDRRANLRLAPEAGRSARRTSSGLRLPVRCFSTTAAYCLAVSLALSPRYRFPMSSPSCSGCTAE
jgi:hypothetical protein